MHADPADSAATIPLDRERDRAHPRQIELYRRASATEKLTVVARLNAGLIQLKEASLQSQFPNLPPTERRALLRRWWLAARD